MGVLVTGGSGFIGSHVVRALRSTGTEVTNLDLRGGTNCDRYVQADILDTDRVTSVMKKHGHEAVFHIGAIANARQALEDPVAAVHTNIGGTAAVLESARRAGVKRVILASTVWVYNGVDRSIKNGPAEIALFALPRPTLRTAISAAGSSAPFTNRF